MGENLLQMLMGMVDSYLVASLRMVALSGVSIANNLLAVYQAVYWFKRSRFHPNWPML